MSILGSCLKRILIAVLGNERFQRALERKVDYCQLLMGIGAGAETLSSGERSIFNTLKRSCIAPYCIFDVGSNKGQFLQLILESIAADPFSIHCFEPGVETFKILTQSCKTDPRIRLNNLGIGKEEGEAKLYYDKLGSELASLTKRKMDHFNLDFGKSETVAVTTIDRYCKENGINRIHLLKLDIEGHELDALAGAKEMFDRKSVDIVTFEFGGCNIDTRTFFQDFWYFFREVNMSLFRITPSGYLYPLQYYKETYEQFRTSNFVGLANV